MGDFCATGTARETQGRFNSGVMVLSPSMAIFNDMLRSVPLLHSYNGGDQGFLNEFIPSWCLGNNTKVSWERALKKTSANIGNHSKVHVACADFGERMHTLATLSHNVTDPWIIHFNHPLGWWVKPWTWVVYPTHPVHWEWHALRRTLPDEAARSRS